MSGFFALLTAGLFLIGIFGMIAAFWTDDDFCMNASMTAFLLSCVTLIIAIFCSFIEFDSDCKAAGGYVYSDDDNTYCSVKIPD